MISIEERYIVGMVSLFTMSLESYIVGCWEFLELIKNDYSLQKCQLDFLFKSLSCFFSQLGRLTTKLMLFFGWFCALSLYYMRDMEKIEP